MTWEQLSSIACLASKSVVCPSSTLLMMLLLPGWPTMGLNHIRKKKMKVLLCTLYSRDYTIQHYHVVFTETFSATAINIQNVDELQAHSNSTPLKTAIQQKLTLLLCTRLTNLMDFTCSATSEAFTSWCSISSLPASEVTAITTIQHRILSNSNRCCSNSQYWFMFCLHHMIMSLMCIVNHNDNVIVYQPHL